MTDKYDLIFIWIEKDNCHAIVSLGNDLFGGWFLVQRPVSNRVDLGDLFNIKPIKFKKV